MKPLYAAAEAVDSVAARARKLVEERILLLMCKATVVTFVVLKNY